MKIFSTYTLNASFQLPCLLFYVKYLISVVKTKDVTIFWLNSLTILRLFIVTFGVHSLTNFAAFPTSKYQIGVLTEIVRVSTSGNTPQLHKIWLMSCSSNLSFRNWFDISRLLYLANELLYFWSLYSFQTWLSTQVLAWSCMVLVEWFVRRSASSNNRIDECGSQMIICVGKVMFKHWNSS